MSNLQRLPESWAPIKGYEGRFEISNHGRIKGLPIPLSKGGFKNGNDVPFYLKISIKKTGYCEIGLSKESKAKFYLIHRLVASHFIGDIPKGLVINHKDFDKTNNYFENLEIVSYRQNNLHSQEKYGLSPGIAKVKKVSGINNETGEIKIFDSLVQARRYFKVSRATVDRSVNHRTKTYTKFTFTKI